MKFKSLCPVPFRDLFDSSLFSWGGLRRRVFMNLAKTEPIRPISVNDTQEVEVWVFMEKGAEQVDFRVFRLRLDEHPRLKDADHLWIGMGLREGTDTGPNRSAYFHLGPDNRWCRDGSMTAVPPSKGLDSSHPESLSLSDKGPHHPRRIRSIVSIAFRRLYSLVFLSNVRSLAPLIGSALSIAGRGSCYQSSWNSERIRGCPALTCSASRIHMGR